MASTNGDNDAMSIISLLSNDTTSSKSTLSSVKKRTQTLFFSLGTRLSGKSSLRPSSSPLPSPTSIAVNSMAPSEVMPTTEAQKHPQERDWDAAFGELASSYGFSGGPIPGGRPVAPSKSFTARTTPDASATENPSKKAPTTSTSSIGKGENAKRPSKPKGGLPLEIKGGIPILKPYFA
ncbi:hypothetical protein K488DRAFT_82211 [Vararia minispora EC-137]|uniref:Uncharacterized protein n=1 Tax=Vararia minispora EC-137 TaxID=1314806 RepID=A0ACB8QX48_9AGAM|nr:hypothetical protein K488DRAFT_82211 [Vararia minispora EC-137]